MTKFFDLKTQRELLPEADTNLGKTLLKMVEQFQTAFWGPQG